ncbi:MAG: 4-hydroxybenzoate octaprenyltransferase [Aestuariivita sp.]|nr:4-hydroxybenzoate octaprenyltransferase [Aestuariivita sp.]
MQKHAPIPDQQVSDASANNWVDKYAPIGMRPYLRLSRIDRPIGTWLLLIPCWWGLALGILNTKQLRLEDAWIALGCAIGAMLMRGAGCTWNDITDCNFDRLVVRTKSRPIASGQISVSSAIIWMCVQAIGAFCILLTFNLTTIALGVLSLLPVAIYPFAKRFTWWPQIFLGIAFNWGALLAWAAHTGSLHLASVLLYGAGIFWTLFYDTIYAHQDRDDDALIGIKSTAILFGKKTPIWLLRFLTAAIALMSLAVIVAVIPVAKVYGLLISIMGVAAMCIHLEWQRQNFVFDDTKTLLKLFRSNRDAGLIFLLFLSIAAFINSNMHSVLSV